MARCLISQHQKKIIPISGSKFLEKPTLIWPILDHAASSDSVLFIYDLDLLINKSGAMLTVIHPSIAILLNRPNLKIILSATPTEYEELSKNVGNFDRSCSTIPIEPLSDETQKMILTERVKSDPFKTLSFDEHLFEALCALPGPQQLGDRLRNFAVVASKISVRKISQENAIRELKEQLETHKQTPLFPKNLVEFPMEEDVILRFHGKLRRHLGCV